MSSPLSTTDAPAPEQISGVRRLPGCWPWLPRLAALSLALITLDYLLNLGLLTVFTRVESQFFYTVVALMLPLVYLLWPIWPGVHSDRVPWYDVLLFLFAAKPDPGPNKFGPVP